MKQTMRSIRFNQKSRAEVLHIEIPGGIVNIRCDLRDWDGHEVTSVSITRDESLDGSASLSASVGKPTERWWFADHPQADAMNIRLALKPCKAAKKSK